MSVRFRNASCILLFYFISATVVFAQSGEDENVMEETDNFGSGDGEANLKARDVEDTCRPEFAREKDHTMCLEDSPKVYLFGVNEQNKRIIIDYHNQVRRDVKPKAADLTVLSWDDELAEVAQKWAKQCKKGHDKNRNIPAWGMHIGQNMAWCYNDWKTAMKVWHRNRTHHHRSYKQMVFNGTNRVGCGYAECEAEGDRIRRFYVCNYAQGNETPLRDAYTRSSKSCSSCPNTCNQGLCDCTGPNNVDMCLNRGRLDINTCTCSCSGIYKGATCNQRGTPTSCRSTKTNSRPSKPKARTTTTTTTATPVFVSPYNCKFYETRPSKEKCKTFGDHGTDTEHCASRGGSVTCDDCEYYSEYCPVMCGLCDAPCSGKKCHNGGSLDTTTCKCSCVRPYFGDTCDRACSGKKCHNGGSLDTTTCKCSCVRPYFGDTCDRVKCPPEDGPICSHYPKESCKSIVYVQGDCPYMCGLCPEV